MSKSPLTSDTQRAARFIREISTDMDMLYMAVDDAVDQGVDFALVEPVLAEVRRELGVKWAELRRLVGDE
jgi:hypothetical protein